MDIIHEAPKCFWKWRCTLDVCIVHHTSFDVIEVIAFEPSIARESSRIFVDCSALALMVSETDVLERAKKLKEPFLRRKENPDVNKMDYQALNDAKAELIMNRLQIEEFSLGSRTLRMMLVQTMCDVEKSRPMLVCSKPPGLRSYSWNHSSACTSKDVEQNLEVLDINLTGAKMDNVAAAKFEQTARSALTVRERWRVALVFGKVAKGRRLSAKDSKIWDAVSSKLRSPDTTGTTGAHAGHHTDDSEDEKSGRQHGRSTPRLRKRSDPSRGYHKPHPSPRTLTPRESVEHHVQSLTPRSYSVSGGLLHAVSEIGAKVGGITQSLERSLGTVAGASLDTRNKHYRVAASVELNSEDLGKDESLEATVHMHSFHSRPTSAHSAHQGLHETVKPLFNLTVDTSAAPYTPSRPQSAATTPYHGRSMRAHTPVSRIPSHDAADVPPAMKRKLSKQAAIPSTPTACDLANKQLTAMRMLKSLARAGAAVRKSMRASFSNDTSKVYADAAAAAAAAVLDANECNNTLRIKPVPASKNSTCSTAASASVDYSGMSALTNTYSSSSIAAEAGQSAHAAGVGAARLPVGGFGSGGFLSVDVIRSMVRKVTFT